MNIEDSSRILGVAVSAKIGEAKDAWQKLARILHPDKHSSADLKEVAETKLKELNLAYEVFKERGDVPASNENASTTTSDRTAKRPKAREDHAPEFDLNIFWREVERISGPRFRYSRPTPQTHSVSPTPLPPSAIPGRHPQIQRTNAQKIVGWIAVSAVILMVPLSSRLFGLNVVAAFSVLWCIYEWLALKAFDAENQPWLRTLNELQTEYLGRERVRQSVISMIESAEACSRDLIEKSTREFDRCLTQLWELKSQFAIEAHTNCRFRLQSGLRDLLEISQRGRTELESLNSQIRELVNRLAQAEADVAVSKTVLASADAEGDGIWLPRNSLVAIASCVGILCFLGNKATIDEAARVEAAKIDEVSRIDAAKVAAKKKADDDAAAKHAEEKKAAELEVQQKELQKRDDANKSQAAERLTQTKELLKKSEIAAAKKLLSVLIDEFGGTPSASQAQTLLSDLEKQEKAAQSKLRIAKQFLARRDEVLAKKWLTELISAYPQTEATVEARQLLRKL